MLIVAEQTGFPLDILISELTEEKRGEERKKGYSLNNN